MRSPKNSSLIFLLCLATCLPTFAQSTKVENESSNIQLSDDGRAVRIQSGNELFCKFDYRSYAKPIFYPIQLQPGLSMTRNFPMQIVDGEAKDHPHHMSMWMGHIVSGVDFWTGKSGTIKFKNIEAFDSKNKSFTVVNLWVRNSDKTTLLEERSSYQFGANSSNRWIYADVTFTARQDVEFDDTKEGLFAIRTHPNLRLAPNQKQGVLKVTGKAINDSGIEGKSVWGKPAKWLDYHGAIQDKNVGISLFDHPGNLRHPTTWHAREYGLIAANPFGLHYFNKAPKGAGKLALKKGQSLNLKYGIRFYVGSFDKSQTEKAFQHFASTMKPIKK